jgi:hypothetical protein
VELAALRCAVVGTPPAAAGTRGQFLRLLLAITCGCCLVRMSAAVARQDAARTEFDKASRIAGVVADQLITTGERSGGEPSFDLSSVEGTGAC